MIYKNIQVTAGLITLCKIGKPKNKKERAYGPAMLRLRLRSRWRENPSKPPQKTNEVRPTGDQRASPT
jgi:hypothetical protein